MGKIGEIIKKLMYHKTPVIIISAFAVLVIVYFVLSGSGPRDFSEKYREADFSDYTGNASAVSVGRTNTYTRYLERYAHIQPAAADISLDIFSWSSAGGVSPLNNFIGIEKVLRTEEESFLNIRFM